LRAELPHLQEQAASFAIRVQPGQRALVEGDPCFHLRPTSNEDTTAMPGTKQDATPPQEPSLARLVTLLESIKDRTASPETEQWLNREYGVQSDLYQEIAGWVNRGVEEGWAANFEIDGPRYRRSLLSAPCEKTFFFSITAVLMDSAGNTQGHPEDSFRVHFHAHPYGVQNGRPAGRWRRASRTQRLVSWSLDVAGPWKPPLPGGPGRRGDLVDLSSGGTHFVRCSTTTVSASCVSPAFLQ
jgi:hypothetical protein